MPKLSFRSKLLLLVLPCTIIPLLLFIVWIILILKPPFPNIHILITGVLTIISVAVIEFFLLQRLIKNHFGKLFFLLHKSPTFLPSQIKVNQTQDEIESIIQVLDSYKLMMNNYTNKLAQLEQIVSFEREKLSFILSNIIDPVIGIDIHSNILFFNKSAVEVMGADPDDSLNQPIEKLFKFVQKGKDLPLKLLFPFLPIGQSGTLFSGKDIKTVSLLNNKESFADISTFQLKTGPASNLAAIIICHDSTTEKQLEAMKLDFVSMAAHELRTPLTSIKGYLSVFIQENEKKLSEDQMMFIRRISTSTQQLSALVENLLSVARVERGAMNITTQPTDWNKNVQMVKEMFEHRALEKRIELTFDVPKIPIPTIQVDTVRINEVLDNFIANAINYTEPGGKIRIWIELKNQELITHVTDTGRGIPPDALAHLFTKFYRIPGNVEQASKGNGLGLYISKAIIDLHKGRIWADSTGLGKGSTFSFSLPVTESGIIDLNILTKKL